jgi:hypothetical protein
MLRTGVPPHGTTITILRYLDNQERPEHQTDASDAHARELSAELNVIDRRRRAC